LWGTRARPALLAALDDPEKGVHIAALAGLRRAGGVDAGLLRRLARILATTSIDADLRAMAAATLAEVPDALHDEAVATLSKAIAAHPRSLMDRLRGASGGHDDPALVEAIAKALLAIGGATGRSVVEKRATEGPEAVRKALTALLTAKVGHGKHA
ncbi:MAG: hypothetical protein ACHREM_32090, partial [Polyangiales bacterium]